MHDPLETTDPVMVMNDVIAGLEIAIGLSRPVPPHPAAAM
jgi:hypothetical protein